MTQHASLSPERWARFPRSHRLLMIANEMNRASASLSRAELSSLRLAYERVLRLADLTVEVDPHPPLRRELLRWRDLVAELYVAERPREDDHRAALRSLLQLSPATAAQIPFLLSEPEDPSA